MKQSPFFSRAKLACFGSVQAAVVIWAIVVNLGFLGLFAYVTRPGPEAAAPGVWPGASGLVRDSSRACLLIFVHPRCPCTEATLQELSEIIALAGNRLSARVIFLEPLIDNPAWSTGSGSWRLAEDLPGVAVVLDRGGVETKVFGAKTSGQVMLFDRLGHLVFQGGITAARGEVGANTGSEAVIAFLENIPPKINRTRAYGCPLFASEDAVK